MGRGGLRGIVFYWLVLGVQGLFPVILQCELIILNFKHPYPSLSGSACDYVKNEYTFMGPLAVVEMQFKVNKYYDMFICTYTPLSSLTRAKHACNQYSVNCINIIPLPFLKIPNPLLPQPWSYINPNLYLTLYKYLRECFKHYLSELQFEVM